MTQAGQKLYRGTFRVNDGSLRFCFVELRAAAEVWAMEFEKWWKERQRQAPTIVLMAFVAAIFVVAVLHRWLPAGVLYLFLWDLAHQILFYIGGVLAFAEMIMLKWLDTPLEKKVFTGLALFCIFLASFQAWVDEHRNVEELIQQKTGIVGEREFWKSQSYAKDQSVRENVTALSQTQLAFANLSEKVLAITSPGPAAVIVRMTSLSTSFKDKDGLEMRLWLIVAFVDKNTAPFRGTLRCDKPISLYSGRVALPDNVDTLSMGPYPVGDRAYRVQYTDPPVWKPDTPIIFAVMQTDRPSCKFNLD